MKISFFFPDCPGGLDFLCHNLRCISMLLNCDGFDHCGDNSDEPPTCSEGKVNDFLSLTFSSSF